MLFATHSISWSIRTFDFKCKNRVAIKIRFLVGKKIVNLNSVKVSKANERCLVSSGPVAADGAGIVPDVSVNPGVAGPKTPDCKLLATRLAHERSLVSVLENQAICFVFFGRRFIFGSSFDNDQPRVKLYFR